MKLGGKGGSNTLTGLDFESKADLLSLLSSTSGYKISKAKIGKSIVYNGELVATCYRKHDLYRYLESRGIDWKKYISKRLLPDDAIYVVRSNSLFIITVKYQQVTGSVDEEIQMCDFEKKQYQKLFSRLNIEVEYIYVLSNWFKKNEYKDVLNYISAVGCQYYFEYLPLCKFGLPVPKLYIA